MQRGRHTSLSRPSTKFPDFSLIKLIPRLSRSAGTMCR